MYLLRFGLLCDLGLYGYLWVCLLVFGLVTLFVVCLICDWCGFDFAF